MKEKSVFFWLLLVLIIATFFRVYHLEQAPPGLYPDEATNGNNALEALRTGDFKIYYPENNGREGLFMNIQAYSLVFFGVNEPWSLRFPSTIFGILTVLGTYLLGRELFSKRVGLLASFFIATGVWHIIFSRIGFRAIMAPFCLVWALYFFHAAVRKALKDKSLSYIWPAIFGGIVMGIGFHTYIAYRVMPLVFFAFVVFYFREKRFWQATGIFLAATFVVALPIGIYYLQHPLDFFGRTAQISVFSSDAPLKDLAINTVKTLGMFNIRGDWNWRHNLSGRPELFWPVGLLFLWGVIVSFRTLFRRGKTELFPQDTQAYANWESLNNIRLSLLIIFGWMAFAFLPVIISSEGLPHALRAILMIPPVFIFAGIGGISVYSYLKQHVTRTWILKVCTGVFLVLLVYEAYQTYFILWGKNPQTAGAFNQDYVDIARTINMVSEITPKYIIVEAGGVDIRGFPTATQTVMFLTDSFDPEIARQKNIHYIYQDKISEIPPRAMRFYIR